MSEKERQIPYDITHMWITHNELFYEIETDSQT